MVNPSKNMIKQHEFRSLKASNDRFIKYDRSKHLLQALKSML